MVIIAIFPYLFLSCHRRQMFLNCIAASCTRWSGKKPRLTYHLFHANEERSRRIGNKQQCTTYSTLWCGMPAALISCDVSTVSWFLSNKSFPQGMWNHCKILYMEHLTIISVNGMFSLCSCLKNNWHYSITIAQGHQLKSIASAIEVIYTFLITYL